MKKLSGDQRLDDEFQPAIMALPKPGKAGEMEPVFEARLGHLDFLVSRVEW